LQSRDGNTVREATKTKTCKKETVPRGDSKRASERPGERERNSRRTEFQSDWVRGTPHEEDAPPGYLRNEKLGKKNWGRDARKKIGRLCRREKYRVWSEPLKAPATEDGRLVLGKRYTSGGSGGNKS